MKQCIINQITCEASVFDKVFSQEKEKVKTNLALSNSNREITDGPLALSRRLTKMAGNVNRKCKGTSVCYGSLLKIRQQSCENATSDFFGSVQRKDFITLDRMADS